MLARLGRQRAIAAAQQIATTDLPQSEWQRVPQCQTKLFSSHLSKFTSFVVQLDSKLTLFGQGNQLNSSGHLHQVAVARL